MPGMLAPDMPVSEQMMPANLGSAVMNPSRGMPGMPGMPGVPGMSPMGPLGSAVMGSQKSSILGATQQMPPQDFALAQQAQLAQGQMPQMPQMPQLPQLPQLQQVQEGQQIPNISVGPTVMMPQSQIGVPLTVPQTGGKSSRSKKYKLVPQRQGDFFF